MEGLQELFETARRAFPAAFRSVTNQIPVTEALQHRFSGLVMLADWLGSHSEAFFPFKHDGLRMEWSRRQAKKALISVGLDSKANSSFLSSRLPSFQEVFGFQPYPLQAHLAGSDLPPLLIVESDTGSGKTEAALIHFLALLAVGQVDSLYFALPTRVAARELYDRVLKTMKKTFGDACPPVLLAVPGYALIDGEPPDILPSEIQLWSERDQHLHERQWSAERPKRFLAATVAVGKDCTVRFEGNSFVVPHPLVGRTIVLRVKEQTMRIFDDDRLVCSPSLVGSARGSAGSFQCIRSRGNTGTGNGPN